MILREALWRAVVNCKYSSMWGRWSSCEVNGLYGVGLWKFIGKGLGEFSRYTRFKVRMTLRLDFGMPCGVGSKPLR